MKAYNPDDFEFSKENTDYIKLKCISCNKPVVLPARFSDGYGCRFCNNHMSAVSYVRRKDRTKLREVVEVCPHCMREKPDAEERRMNRGCDTCQYIDTNAEQEPCVSCVRNYVDKWERQSYEHLINPLKRLAKIQIEKGNMDVADIYAAVLKWIKEEA